MAFRDGGYAAGLGVAHNLHCVVSHSLDVVIVRITHAISEENQAIPIPGTILSRNGLGPSVREDPVTCRWVLRILATHFLLPLTRAKITAWTSYARA